ncbi:MAG TPA: choice-of-anchor tandem repeat GloVer-containing protein [Terriglobales bacterium]|nr:choice-of-anchor tandem repeat GloVer-containing protein [Terriglobales bacterium]
MTKLSARKKASAIFLLCAAMAIAAPAQVFTTLVDFDGANGYGPYDSLVQGFNGHFYGTTVYGGANNWSYCAQYIGCGTIFGVTPAGALTTLHSFCAEGPPCANGDDPLVGLVLAADGVFYGTTAGGGAHSGGTFFKITPKGGFTTIYSFCEQCGDGRTPWSLVQRANGVFYGTTQVGGAYSGGTVFKITSGGTLTTLYSFCADGSPCPDGDTPFAGVVQGSDGNFYGTTKYGGVNCYVPGCGTVFKITPGGKLTTLHGFDGTDGANPSAVLVEASDGNFYGTTQNGGAGLYGGLGTVFKITPKGTLTTLYSFCTQTGCMDGNQPVAGLIQATDGSLYGTTSEGVINIGIGTIFKITLSGTLSTLHTFCAGGPPCLDGVSPEAGLLQATDGNFYGTTCCGGPDSDGTLFRLSVGSGPFVSFVRNPAKVGQAFWILGQGLKGTTGVSFNGVAASFTVKSDTLIRATVPAGAKTGYVTVTTPSGTLTSNVPFHVIP